MSPSYFSISFLSYLPYKPLRKQNIRRMEVDKGWQIFWSEAGNLLLFLESSPGIEDRSETMQEKEERKEVEIN